MENITTLTNKFSDFVELQTFADQQYKALLKAKSKIELQQQEIEHLKLILLSAQLAPSEPELIIKSNEQTICEIEIERLRSTTLERSLTLEETKKLDLLVKNLMLCKGTYKDISVDFKKLPKDISQDTLLAIASLPDTKEKFSDQ